MKILPSSLILLLGVSFITVGCECLDRDMAVWSEFADYVPELGVGHARIQSGWAKTERRKGHYDYAWLDEIVDGLCSRNIKPWMTLCYIRLILPTQNSLTFLSGTVRFCSFLQMCFLSNRQTTMLSSMSSEVEYYIIDISTAPSGFARHDIQ